MKSSIKVAASFVVALLLFMVGGKIRHPYPRFDCFEPHGFPFTYHRDGGFVGGAEFHRGWLIVDVAAYLVLAVLIAWIWILQSRRPGETRIMPK